MRPQHRRYPPQQQRQHRPTVRVVDEHERQFLAGTAIDPSPRIILEKGSSSLTVRAMDLICPIGRGQRGLIVAPPGSGKTTLLKDICKSVAKAYPEIKLYCLLIDERPEEVTDFKRDVPAEVHSSSTDQSYEHHVETADKLMREVFKRVAAGEHVMVVVDSLTRLSRVHNATRHSSGRTLSGGVDARAMEVPRRIFGCARNIEHGGSLTIMASILIETGSRMDEVIFEEFKGTGNMELVLSRDIANHRIFPAIDINQSRTRREELLLTPEESQHINKLRNALMANGNKIEAAKLLVERLGQCPTNEVLLARY